MPDMQAPGSSAGIAGAAARAGGYWRRPGARGTLLRVCTWAALYVLIGMAMLGANPFRGETTGPFDLLASYAGWHAGEPVKVRNPARSDIVDALVPAWMESRRQIRSGHIPLWNPLLAGGHTAIADPAIGQMTLGFALFAAAPDPALGFYLAVLSSLVIAGLGMHFLARRVYSPWAALFAGISYMACGFITAWLFWPQTYSAIWIPWLLLATWRYADTGSVTALVAMAATTALMFLGGFPFVVAMGVGAAIVIGAVSALSLGDRRIALRRMAGVGFGLLLGAALVAVPALSLASAIGSAETGYRTGGSGMTWLTHRMLLVRPWAARDPQVESNMYMGMLAIVFAIVGLVGLARRRSGVLPWTGLALALVGVTLTFGLIPDSIGSRLFVLSNNPWDRGILLLDLGLILLAAGGIDALARRVGSRRAMFVVGMLLCVVQAMDLGVQFRKFNGATPSRYFYTVSPELKLLQDRIKPFQHVGQDSRLFMVSGTLGAVGLGEWFAHSLRSPAMRRMLDDLADEPFTTPTATAIGVDEYEWSSALADSVGLCYAIFPSSTAAGPTLASATGSTEVALPPINGLRVRQPMYLAQSNGLTGIGLKLATYQGSGLDGAVTASLLAQPGDRVVARSELPANAVVDNAIAIFPFDGKTPVDAGDYVLEVQYLPGPANRNMTIWRYSDAPGELQRGADAVPGALVFAVTGVDDSQLRVLSDNGSIVVASNDGCAPGPYWSASTRTPWPDMRPGRARLASYQPDRFTIESTSPDPGFVVVPMQYGRGWEARVDGRSAPIDLVYGVMPAVAVPRGAHQVLMFYAPPHWRLGVAISGIALLVLAALGVLAWRRRRKLRAATAD